MDRGKEQEESNEKRRRTWTGEETPQQRVTMERREDRGEKLRPREVARETGVSTAPDDSKI